VTIDKIFGWPTLCLLLVGSIAISCWQSRSPLSLAIFYPIAVLFAGLLRHYKKDAFKTGKTIFLRVFLCSWYGLTILGNLIVYTFAPSNWKFADLNIDNNWLWLVSVVIAMLILYSLWILEKLEPKKSIY